MGLSRERRVQGAPEERLGSRKFALSLQQAGEVVEALRRLGMLGAEHLRADRQRALQERLGHTARQARPLRSRSKTVTMTTYERHGRKELSLAFCPILQELYSHNSAADATNGTVRQALGLSPLNNLLIIRNLMMELKPKRTIEIGLAAGGSALTFAASHRDLGHTPCRQHVAIDPYQRLWYHLGKTLIARAALSDYVEIIEEPSRIALPLKLASQGTFDLAYVDGSHAFHEVMLDLYYVRHLLADGGVVVFDDCASKYVRRSIRFIRREIVSFREFDLTPFTKGSWRRAIAYALNRSQCVAFQKVQHPQSDEEWQCDRASAWRYGR
jgi:predicted O-methyltransferase YrrM